MKIYKGVPTDAEIESEVKMFNLSLAIAERSRKIAGRYRRSKPPISRTLAFCKILLQNNPKYRTIVLETGRDTSGFI